MSICCLNAMISALSIPGFLSGDERVIEARNFPLGPFSKIGNNCRLCDGLMLSNGGKAKGRQLVKGNKIQYSFIAHHLV